MFIGENLTARQIEVLQAVADATFGAMFASIESIKETLENDDDLESSLVVLEKECLIDRRDIKGKPYVGLTDDGKGCNLICCIV